MFKNTFIFLFITISQLAMSQTSLEPTKSLSTEQCREAIDTFFYVMNFPKSMFEYSDSNFKDFQITQAQFNELGEKEQVRIYEKIKPLKMKSVETAQLVEAVKDDFIQNTYAPKCRRLMLTQEQEKNCKKLIDIAYVLISIEDDLKSCSK